MNDEKLKQLYIDGVRHYKALEFDAHDNPNWANSPESGLQYRKQHFKWVEAVLNTLNTTDNTAAYVANKIIKQLRFETNPSDDWVADNPDDLTCAAIYSDADIILAELEHHINSLTAKPAINHQSDTQTKITYDKQAKQINFAAYEPLSLRNTENQASLCEVLFKSKRPVSNDVMLEKWGYSPDRIYDNHKLKDDYRLKVYHAANDLNEKINKHTNNGVKDLILFTTKVTQINPDYSKFVS